MSWYSDWFLADEAEAEAVASIAVDDGRSFNDWPHLAMKSVGEMELMALRGVLRGQPGEDQDVHGPALYHSDDEDGGVAVTRVTPAFLVELARPPRRSGRAGRRAVATERSDGGLGPRHGGRGAE